MMLWKSEESGNAAIECIDGLFGYAMVLTRNHALAEDLVRETYIRACQAVGRLREGSDMKGWLFTILRSIWLNHSRRSPTGPLAVEMKAGNAIAKSAVETSKNSHDLDAVKIETDRVRAAVQELPLEFRELILLRDYEDLSYQKIASLLDCPVGTVISRLGKARAKLRRLLSPTLHRSSSSEVGTTE